MMDRFCKMKDAIVLYLAGKNNKDAIQITEKDWEFIQELTVVYRPLKTATNELSGEKFTTLSKVIPLATRLLDIYSKVNVEESDEAQTVRKLIYESLKKQFKDVDSSEMLTCATLFDPRFKDQYFKPSLIRSAAIYAAKHEAQKEASEEPEVVEGNEDNDETSEPNVSQKFLLFPLLPNAHQYIEVGNQQERITIFSFLQFTLYFQPELDELWGSMPANKTKSDGVKDCIDLEMKKYLSLPCIGRSENPIKWWVNVGKHQFPNLFLGAQKFQCMTATSVPSERVFSTAGNVITNKRNLLGKECANELICLHHNLE